MKKHLLKIKKYWLKFAELLAFVNTRVLLFLVYFIVFPVFALPMKMMSVFKEGRKETNWKVYDRELDLREQF